MSAAVNPSAPRQKPGNRRPIPPSWIFGGLSALLASGYGVLFTVVADYRDAYGISETAIGWLIGLGFIVAFFAQTLIAPIGDRGHARNLIRVGVLLNIIGILMLGFGESLEVLLAGRVISGLGIGTAIPAIRRIVILADPENLGENLGRLLRADVFGFAMGPALSALLVGPFGLAAPYVIVAAATLVMLAIAESFHVEERVDTSGQRLAFDLLKSRIVAGAVVMGGGVFLMIGAFDALWDVVHDDLGTADWMSNLGITLFAIPLVVFGPFSGRLSQRVGPFKVGGLGLIAGAFFMSAYGQLPSGEWIFAFTMGHALTDGLTVSASGVAVAMAVPEERQSGAQGLIGATQALAGGITAVVIATIYQEHGRAAAYTTGAIGMLIFTAIAMWLGVDFWLRGGHRKALAESLDESSEEAAPRPDRVDPITLATSTRRPRLRRP